MEKPLNKFYSDIKIKLEIWTLKQMKLIMESNL